MTKKIAVIGGGFTGLACATKLREQGAHVHLFERNDRLGGLASGFKETGWNTSLEFFYHHWFQSDAFVLEFAKKWNAQSGLVFKRPLTVMETKGGQFVPLDSAVALLKFPDLNFADKIRMGLVLLYLRKIKNWEELDNETAEMWCIKFMGAAGFQAIWEPLLQGKFGRHWSKRVNMAWLWARLATRTPKLGTFKGGFQEFVNCAEKKLIEEGVQISKGVKDLSLTQNETQKWLVTHEGSQQEFDAVVVAASPLALEQIFPALGTDYRNIFAKKSFLGAQVIILSLKCQLGKNDVYWYSLRKSPECPFLAAIEHTQFVSHEEFAGEHLIYLADYVDVQSEDWNRSDEQLVNLSQKVLKKINPAFEESWLKRSWVFREKYAQPIPEAGNRDRLPPLSVPTHPGLVHASMGHVYPWDRGTNFALELGCQAAAEALKSVAQ